MGLYPQIFWLEVLSEFPYTERMKNKNSTYEYRKHIFHANMALGMFIGGMSGLVIGLAIICYILPR